MNYEKEETLRSNWVLEFPTQIILSVDSIYWTRITEENYLSGDEECDMDEWLTSNILQLEELTELIRGDLSFIQRRTLVALVTQDVHYRDIIEQLRDESIESMFDFKWVMQLRYYWEEEYFYAKQVG